MSIRYKLIICFLVTLLLPIGLLLGLLAGDYNAAVERRLSSLSGQMVQQVGLDLNYRLDVISNLITSSITNEDILDILVREDEENALHEIKNADALKKHFASIIYSSHYIESIIIHRPGKESLIYGPGSEAGNRTSYRAFFRSPNSCPQAAEYEKVVQRATGDIIWRNNLLAGEPDGYIYAGRQFLHFQEMRIVGSIYFVIKNELFEDLSSVTSEDYSLVLDEAGRTVFGEDLQDAAVVDYLETNRKQVLQVTGKKLGRSLLSYQTLDNGWTFVSSVSLNGLLHDLSATWNRILFVVLLLAGLAVVVAVSFSNSLTRRLQKVVDKAVQVESGLLTLPAMTDTHRDEIGKLDVQFNKMVERLGSLIQTNYIHQLEKKQAQLDALQYQINPHFLYNTLEVINSIAAVERQTTIREICKRLGMLFRYNLSGSKADTARLGEELAHLENYIYLQQLQTSKHFEVFYDVPPESVEMLVLKFILQPVVENCIKHGFLDDDQTRMIEISVSYDDRQLVIQVADDGKGIAAERMEEIRKGLTTVGEELHLARRKIGIGLYNVHERIRLTYGEDFGLSLENILPHGTCATIRLPNPQGKEKGNVHEDTDC